jgi:transposase
MKNQQQLLTDEQWKLIEPLLPQPIVRQDRRGRPWASNRDCFEGILWVLQTGSAWRFLPDEFPSPSTCWRRLNHWVDKGVWIQAWRELLGVLNPQELLKWEEAFLSYSFTSSKNGPLQSAKRGEEGAQSGWYWSTVKVFHLEYGWKMAAGKELIFRNTAPVEQDAVYTGSQGE